MPSPVHFYIGDAGDSDIALLNNQNVKVVLCGPPPQAALQMFPPGAELFQSHSVPHSALMLQLISHFPRVRYFRTPLIIFHFAPGKCIEHDVRM